MRTAILLVSIGLFDVAQAIRKSEASSDVVKAVAVMLFAAIVMDLIDFARAK